MVPARLVARTFSLALLTFLLVCRGGHSLKCFHQLSPCACVVTADNSSVLDFSPLDAGGSVRIAFQAQDEHVPPRRFEYNPCSPFYCHLELSSAVCVANWLPEDQNLGTQSSAVFKETYDPFSITISYSNQQFHADVTYECRHNVQGKFYIVDVSDAQYFQFRVETEYACLDYKPAPIHTPTPEEVEEPPWALLVVLIIMTLVLAYFVVGTFVQCFAGGKKGFDAVPHADMWRAIGNKITTGCRWLRQRLSGRAEENSGLIQNR